MQGKHKTEAEKLKPQPSWEDWAKKQKLSQQLDYDEAKEKEDDDY